MSESISALISTPANEEIQALPLSIEHHNVLLERGIPIEYAQQHGIVAWAECHNVWRRKNQLPTVGPTSDPEATGLKIPYQDGKAYRIRLDKKVNGLRYWTPAGQKVIPFFPNEFRGKAYEDANAALLRSNTQVPLYIVEAPLKALSMSTNGFPCIGLGGVLAGAHDATLKAEVGELFANPELLQIQWHNRRVFVIFDAGVSWNPNVALGAVYVWASLMKLGADVWFVRLPETNIRDFAKNGRGDQGPDDFLHANGKEALQALIDKAEPLDPVKRLEALNLAGLSNKDERAQAVVALAGDLVFQAGLHVGGLLGLQRAKLVLGNFVPAKILNDSLKEFQTKKLPKSDDAPAWTSSFVTSRDGSVKPCLQNVNLVLQHDEKLWDHLKFNELTGRVEVTVAPWHSFTGSWTDVCTIELGLYLATEYGIHVSDLGVIDKAVLRMASTPAFSYDPIKEYFKGLKWDGTERLDTWVRDYLGAEDTPLNRAFGARWLIGACQRAMKPGCKFDQVLVLEGKTNAGKSTVVEILGKDWFSEASLGDLKSKDSQSILNGKWIQELSEGVIFNRADAAEFKRFISTRVDTFRRAYDKYEQDNKRRTCFVITTNEASYLKDDTGNRRFWPILVGTIELECLRNDIDQIWAEVYQRYLAGGKCYLDTSETELMEAAEAAQEARRTPDPWASKIEEHLRNKANVDHSDNDRDPLRPHWVNLDALLSMLDIPLERRHQGHSNKVAKALQTMKWTKVRLTGLGRPWVYVPPEGWDFDPSTLSESGLQAHEGQDDPDFSGLSLDDE